MLVALVQLAVFVSIASCSTGTYLPKQDISKLKPSQNIVDFVKGFEGLNLTAYTCPAGIWTIGYGHTKNVKKGDQITLQQANQFLTEDLTDSGKQMVKIVKVPMTQNQYDSLVSFTFNLGIGNLQSSTLLRKLNAGDDKGASEEFLKWNHARVGGVLKVLDGLTKRRKAEKDLFLTALNLNNDKKQ
ncbi:MAG: putative lysozyme [Streblomastix strix]|uniref:Putative lysozyme n=1 Tax=Streblomastix strix TaxID=222440 RepID=A0A5J4X7D3_9EUKA|nr:MAG: putative lysozyme [Streblomastix strix]